MGKEHEQAISENKKHKWPINMFKLFLLTSNYGNAN